MFRPIRGARWLCAVPLLVATPVRAAQAPPVRSALSTGSREAVARFATQLQADVAADDVGSITAAVHRGPTVLWTRSFGFADHDRRVPADSATVYRVGSISKTVTAALLMVLVDSGIVRLDDTVSRYFPEIERLNDEAGGYPITFRQLASHTAGLIREPRLENAAAGPIAGWQEKILASIPTTAFQDPPGHRYSYSNIGYGILGLALSRVAHRPFMDLIEDLVFSPLGMTHSTFVVPPEVRGHLSTGYANRRDGRIDADQPAREHAGRGYKVPNGGVYTTVHDLAKFAAGLAGAPPHFLSDAARSEMLAVQTPEREDRGYGIGLSLQRQNGVWVASHGGSVAGYTAHMAFEPETGLGVILLRNYNSGETNLGEAAATLLRELVAAESRSAGLRPPASAAALH